MPPTNRRPDRVAEAIREEVATFLAADEGSPCHRARDGDRGGSTRDLRHAKIFVSVLGTESERSATFEGLASVAHHLKTRVGRALRLRVVPEIEFKADDSIAHAARIETLLSQIKYGTPPSAEPAPEESSD